LTHIERQPVDVDLALRQWHGYVDALAAHGWEIVEVPPADDCPDAVFVEDTMVVMDDVAVMALPGAEPRRPEIEGAEAAVRALGYRVEHIFEPATLEGGDVLKVGRTVYVGLGTRTNALGATELRSVLGALDATVVTVPHTRALHLKSAVTALPDDTFVGHPDYVDDPTVFPRFEPVPEPTGAQVVLLGDGGLLMSADAPETAARYRELGYDPVPVDITEFEKLEACVTCLSVRLRTPPTTPT
jgi:dimethylargininase